MNTIAQRQFKMSNDIRAILSVNELQRRNRKPLSCNAPAVRDYVIRRIFGPGHLPTG